MGWMQDEAGLEKCAANYVPLTPLSHLARAAKVWPDRDALVYGEIRRTYAQYHARVSRLASALAKAGIAPGDVVATVLPNIPAQSEAAFGVPACGAVLNTINTRLDVDTIAYIFDHGGAKAALVDSQFLPNVMEAIARMDGPAPMVIEVPDLQAGIAPMGHDGPPERCRLSPSRCIPYDDGHADFMANDPSSEVAANRAAVSL